MGVNSPAAAAVAGTASTSTSFPGRRYPASLGPERRPRSRRVGRAASRPAFRLRALYLRGFLLPRLRPHHRLVPSVGRRHGHRQPRGEGAPGAGPHSAPADREPAELGPPAEEVPVHAQRGGEGGRAWPAETRSSWARPRAGPGWAARKGQGGQGGRPAGRRASSARTWAPPAGGGWGRCPRDFVSKAATGGNGSLKTWQLQLHPE